MLLPGAAWYSCPSGGGDLDIWNLKFNQEQVFSPVPGFQSLQGFQSAILSRQNQTETEPGFCELYAPTLHLLNEVGPSVGQWIHKLPMRQEPEKKNLSWLIYTHDLSVPCLLPELSHQGSRNNPLLFCIPHLNNLRDSSRGLIARA